ncbi:MAG: GreA/GreB family elongation factor [Planctomycetota bacterium]
MSSTTSSKLVQLTQEGQYEQAEEQWLASVEEGTLSLDRYWNVASGLIAAGRADNLGALLAVLLESKADSEHEDGLVQFTQRAVGVAVGDRAVRKNAAKIFSRAGRPELVSVLELMAGADGEKLRDRVARGMHFRAGGFVSGTFRVGPEKIVRFDPETKEFVLTDGNSERSLNTADATGELTPLPDDDFRALLRFDVERLRAAAETEPGPIVESALRSSGGRLEWTQMKKLFARGVVPPNAFARWWKKTRGLVERNPMIQVYGDKEPVLILRTEPISHEEELKARIMHARTKLDRVVLVMEYIESVDQGHNPSQAFLEECATTLADIANDGSTPDPVALLAATVLSGLRERLGGSLPRDVDLPALLARSAEGFRDTPAILGKEERARMSLFFLREHGPEIWPRVFASALPSAPGKLADLLARELLKEGRGEELAAAIQAILASPDRCGDGLFWLFKASTAGTLDDAPCKIDQVAITLAMLRLMDRWARSARSQVTVTQRSLLGKMRSSISANRYRAMNKVLSEIGSEHAMAFYQAIKENQGITDGSRHYLSEWLKTGFQDIIVGRKQLYEEDVIYVSPAGLQRRQKEFDQIVNVDMVKNSAAIGHAADFGDLSENAEFTAALEQRDFLSRRANEIGEEIKQAALIPFGSVTTDFVNVGTRVTVRNTESREEESFSFLGPWDADPDRNVYSYLAPFSQTFLGRKVGETVESNHGETARKLEIIAIELAEVPQ